jgi:acetyl esterase/lipase
VASWQARGLNGFVRLVVRRRHWGSKARLTRRARLLFGAPPAIGGLWTIGLSVERVRENGVSGIWLRPRQALPGAMLYLHGGGFVSCSPDTHRPITGALARLSRRAVFSADYRLAPEHPFPAALDDAFDAYRWMLDRERPGALALAGDSAGGGLVLSLLLRAREESLPMPACAVLLSPWADLTGDGVHERRNARHCPMFHPENITQFASAYLAGHSARDPLVSPILADLSGLPPVLIQAGSSELLLDDARQVHEGIQHTDGFSRLDVFDRVSHGWHMLDGIVPEARTALAQAAQFVSVRLA